MRVRAPVSLLALLLTVLVAGCGSSKSPPSKRADVGTTTTNTTSTTGTTPGTTTGASATHAKGKGSAAAKKAKAKAKAKAHHNEGKAAHHASAKSSGGGSSGSSSSSSSNASAPSSSPSPASAPAAKPKHHTTRHRSRPARPKKPAAPSGPLVATLHAPNHSPKVGHWPISVDLAKGGTPVAGHISYVFLFNGTVVSRQKVAQPPIPPGGAHSPNFTGHFHDVLTWPDRAVGIPLTLRVVVRSKYGTKNLDWAVKVHR